MYKTAAGAIHSLAWIPPSIKITGREALGLVLTLANMNSLPSNDVPGTSKVTKSGYSSASSLKYSLIYKYTAIISADNSEIIEI